MDETELEKLSPGRIAQAWWERLLPNYSPDGRRSGDAGAFARLRRVESLFDAAVEAVTFDLVARLKPVLKRRRYLSQEDILKRAALMAAVLAHVRESDSRKVAAAAGEKKPGAEMPLLHPLRLRRLLAARTPEEMLDAFRRLVALLGKTANVTDLAETLFDWPDERYGDPRRTRWAFDYYGAGAAAPVTPAEAVT